MAVDIGEAIVAALGMESQAFVIEAHEMEHGGLDIVNVDGILNDVETELIGSTDGLASFDAASGHPDGEGLWMVVTTQGTA